MDQKKIGYFLKELRKEKGITQEKLAEQLGVAGRTVSRWETGSNMPDISLLVEIAEFFEVSIQEIINGERKSEKMNEEIKEVAVGLSNYATAEKETIIKDIRNYSIFGTIALVAYVVLDSSKLFLQNIRYEEIAMFFGTLAFVSMLLILAHTTGLLLKIRKKNLKSETKTIPTVVKYIIGVIIAFVGSVLIKLLVNGIWG